MLDSITVGQQKIIDAARHIIISKGMENLTVREIAAELDITDGALYRHFKSKGEIISLLIDDIEETLLGAIDEAASKTKKPLEKLENIFWSHLSYVEKRKGVSFIVINNTISIKDKTLQNKVYGVVNKYLDRIKKILREGIKSGDFHNMNLEAASLTFFGIIQCMVTLWGLSDYKHSLGKERLEELFKFFKNGILAK
ncbi:MAG: TetR/AcrR family transcriptional regulator [Candidatus Omnitrophica bacterium]|nr:TetR/AcrR family transcriptional regulator [Candidatus Omnitrophota bacterium]